MENINVKVQGLKCFIGNILLKPYFESKTTKYTRQYGGHNHGKMMYKDVIEKLYKSVPRKGFWVGYGAIEWLNKHSDELKFNITEVIPSRNAISDPLVVPEKLLNSSKFKVKGKERFYFYEALEACFKNPHGTIKLPTGCLRSDTMIPLLDGRTVSISSLENEDEFWVYSCKPDGTIVPGRGHSARITKKVNKIYKLTLDDNSIIYVTGNHPFMLRDGTYKKVKDLKIKDSLMPSRVTQNKKDNRSTFRDNKLGVSIKTQYMIANELWPNRDNKLHVHHKDGLEKNNVPSNLELLSQVEHSSHHWKELHKIPGNPLGEDLKKYYSNPKHQSYAAKQRTEKGRLQSKNQIISYNKSKKGREESKRRAAHMHDLLRNKTPKEKELINVKRSIGVYKSQCKVYHNNTPMNCDKCKQKYLNRIAQAKKLDPDFNHTIKNIEIIETNEDVWDITVDKYHNFAISTRFTKNKGESGVFVHNSGKSPIQLTLAYNQSKYIGTGMILVPTLIIKDQFIKSAKNFGINLIDYKDYNPLSPKGTIFVTTHHILCERLKNKETKKSTQEELNSVDFVIVDEAAHATCSSWFNILINLNNCQRCHGFSALPVAFETDKGKSFNDLNSDDARTIGILGSVLYEKTAYELRDFLNLPDLINIKYEWPSSHYKFKNDKDWESIRYAKDWHTIRKAIILNNDRTKFIAKIMKYLITNGYKTATFVNQKKHAENILKYIDDSRVACWFGGGVAFTKDCTIDQDYLKDSFGKDLLGLILTSHGIEGLDFDSPLNVLVLHDGKSVRQTVQKVGRVVRPDDKASIVLNICDRGCTILPKHANIRASDIINEFMSEPINCSTFDQFIEALQIIEETKDGD